MEGLQKNSLEIGVTEVGLFEITLHSTFSSEDAVPTIFLSDRFGHPIDNVKVHFHNARDRPAAELSSPRKSSRPKSSRPAKFAQIPTSQQGLHALQNFDHDPVAEAIAAR